MKYLLDTCVFAEYSNLRPRAKVIDWVEHQPSENTFISVLTVGEIEKGIARMPTSKRRNSLEEVLGSLILRFDNRVLTIDTAVMRRWGRLMGSLEKKGRILPVIDSLLAATALEHGLTIVTRNEDDFSETDVAVLNIWDS